MLALRDFNYRMSRLQAATVPYRRLCNVEFFKGFRMEGSLIIPSASGFRFATIMQCHLALERQGHQNCQCCNDGGLGLQWVIAKTLMPTWGEYIQGLCDNKNPNIGMRIRMNFRNPLHPHCSGGPPVLLQSP